LQSGANDARSDDTSRLKIAVAEWLNSRDPYNASLGEARIPTKEKEGRGMGNDCTGRLLCPIEHDWDNPKYVDNFFSHIPSNFLF
jgi:hypothetical protein